MRTARLIVVAAALVMGIAASHGAFAAADVHAAAAAQLKTAIAHAKAAQQYQNMRTVKEHLQHVINCIEGARGAQFRADGGNPCQGQGSGLLPDAKAAGSRYADAVGYIDLAGSTAAIGVKATTLEKARAASLLTQRALETAEKTVMGR